MAIKGKSVIELYNPNTRIKQRYEDENIVTNAFKYIFGQNICAGANRTFMNNFLPLYKKGIGGIILFDSQIEENPDIVVAPNTVGCTGYASTDAYSGTDLSRGGMNVNETELIDNGMKLVWDFATSQANGDIACVSLTHVNGGKVGYGSKNYCDGGNILMPDMIQNIIKSSETGYYAQCIVNDILYAVEFQNPGVLKLKKYKLYSQDVGLKNYYAEPKLIVEKEIETSLTGSFNIYIKTDKNKVYIMTRAESSKIIDITDFENIKEYLFPVSVIANMFSVRDNIAYLNTSALKIELYSLADTTAKLNEITTNYSIDVVSNINGYIVLGREMLDANDEIRYIYNGIYNDASVKNAGFYDNGIIVPYMFYSGSSVYTRYSIISNYLATINNLKVPITKTSAQTMKITYTLTES